MLKQSTAALPIVSSNKDVTGKLRTGQKELQVQLQGLGKNDREYQSINIRWPGGYGKSIGIALAYSHWVREGRLNNLLIVVYNDKQRDQMVKDFAIDALQWGGLDVGRVFKYVNEPSSQRAAMRGTNCVFVCTIQQISAAERGHGLIAELLNHGVWMIAADEYHHYAEEMDWGKALKVLVDKAEFTLATSATPDRDGPNTIFGKPDFVVGYREAAEDKCVKKVILSKYNYRIEALDEGNTLHTYTTSELRGEVEDDGGKKKTTDMSEFETKRKLRYSSKYILPLVSEPLIRLSKDRWRTNKPLQCLVRAMTCAHAKSVCEQIRAVVDEFSVDWVGTGESGRSDQENAQILRKFCPPKNSKGIRPAPELDVLVQVGMASEGFDTIYVSEIVDLSLVTLKGTGNMTKQFYYRGTRFIDDDIDLHVNVPTDHPLAGIDKNSIMSWFDDVPVKDLDKPSDGDGVSGDYPWPELPPTLSPIEIQEVELIDIESDTLDRCRKAYAQEINVLESSISDEVALNVYRRMYEVVQKQNSQQMTMAEYRSQIDRLVGRIANRVAKLMNGGAFEKSRLIDMKRRINGRIKNRFGARESLLEDELQELYHWLRGIDMDINEEVIPTWL